MLDELARSKKGQEPAYESEWRRLFERFQFTLFMYHVGACVALEVLAVAREVIQSESQSTHADLNAAADHGNSKR